MAKTYGKRMVPEYLITKLEELEPGGGDYTAGTGIEISDENVISVDTDTIATKDELFSGSYNDLTNKPSIPTTATSTSSVTPTTETLTFTYSDNTTGTITFITAATVSTTTTLS